MAFSTIDNYVRAAGKQAEQTLNALADDLNVGAKNEREKARAIFTWIADRIAYDAQNHFAGTPQNQDYSAENILKTRISVCAGAIVGLKNPLERSLQRSELCSFDLYVPNADNVYVFSGDQYQKLDALENRGNGHFVGTRKIPIAHQVKIGACLNGATTCYRILNFDTYARMQEKSKPQKQLPKKRLYKNPNHANHPSNTSEEKSQN